MQLLISPKLELRSPQGVQRRRRRLRRPGSNGLFTCGGGAAPKNAARAHIGPKKGGLCNVHYRRSIIGESAQPLKSTVLEGERRMQQPSLTPRCALPWNI